MRRDIFTMPEIRFVGGQSLTLRWNLYRKNGTPYNAQRCTGNFSVIDYSDQDDETILINKSVTFLENKEGIINIAQVDLVPSDTKSLDGKYIYQITIKDVFGEIEIPDQGFLQITHNINEGFIN